MCAKKNSIQKEETRKVLIKRRKKAIQAFKLLRFLSTYFHSACHTITSKNCINWRSILVQTVFFTSKIIFAVDFYVVAFVPGFDMWIWEKGAIIFLTFNWKWMENLKSLFCANINAKLRQKRSGMRTLRKVSKLTHLPLITRWYDTQNYESQNRKNTLMLCALKTLLSHPSFCMLIAY